MLNELSKHSTIKTLIERTCSYKITYSGRKYTFNIQCIDIYNSILIFILLCKALNNKLIIKFDNNNDFYIFSR